MTNLEIIRKAVIKANPEIMELKFGCKFVYFGEKRMVVEVLENSLLRLEDGELTSKIKLETLIGVNILGREIRLADVLLAFGESCKNNPNFNKNEWDLQHFKAHNVLKIVGEWDLLHDNLELQSEETIKFLVELLK